MINKIVKLFMRPRLALAVLLERTSALWPDRTYLEWRFRLSMGRKLDLNNPVTFNEKLQWLKFYNRKPEYTVMVDKVKAKEYVAEKLGSEYIIPTLGVWDDPDEIDFDALPNQFVLKCNHNSGLGMCICRDKSKLDIPQVKADLRRGLRQNYFLHGREWPYKDVHRKILAEKFMVDESATELKDYKVFCFDGEPEIVEVDYGRFTEHKRNFYGKNWDFIKMEIEYPSEEKHAIARPEKLEEMLELARKLAKGIPHVRADFYSINNQLYWGELTFFHEAGMGHFNPEKWDERFGKLIKSPSPIYNEYLIINEGYILSVRSVQALDGDLCDFKFFCFNGEPRLCQVITDRSTDEKIDFYDMDWQRQQGLLGLVGKNDTLHNSDFDVLCPHSFSEMKRMAKILAEDIPFSRIDFYEINKRPYFGEITFFPASGFGEFRPAEWNVKIGAWLDLEFN